MLDLINESDRNFNMYSDYKKFKLACFTSEFSYAMGKQERLKDFEISRFYFIEIRLKILFERDLRAMTLHCKRAHISALKTA